MRYRAGTAAWRLVHGAYRVAERGVSRQRAWAASGRVGTMAVVLATLSGCGGGGATADDRARATPAAAESGGSASGGVTTGAPPSGSAPVCPATGIWQVCNVVERLDRAGLAPRRDSGLVREEPLSAPGVAIQLGRSELRVFLYADRAARERDQSRLDARRYAAATEPLALNAEATLIVSENLLAILRSRSDHQRERVSDALTAGPPQSSRAKD